MFEHTHRKDAEKKHVPLLPSVEIVFSSYYKRNSILLIITLKANMCFEEKNLPPFLTFHLLFSDFLMPISRGIHVRRGFKKASNTTTKIFETTHFGRWPSLIDGCKRAEGLWIKDNFRLHSKNLEVILVICINGLF